MRNGVFYVTVCVGLGFGNIIFGVGDHGMGSVMGRVEIIWCWRCWSRAGSLCDWWRYWRSQWGGGISSEFRWRLCVNVRELTCRENVCCRHKWQQTWKKKWGWTWRCGRENWGGRRCVIEGKNMFPLWRGLHPKKTHCKRARLEFIWVVGMWIWPTHATEDF